MGVLRELLTNIFKHARAQAVEIEVGIVDDRVKLVVADDGLGIPESAPRRVWRISSSGPRCEREAA